MFPRLYRTLKLWVAIFISCLFVLFAVVNREIIAISLFPLPYHLDLPKFLLAIICFGAGLLVGGIVMTLKLSRAKSLLRKEHKHVMALQNEVAGAREEKQLILPQTHG